MYLFKLLSNIRNKMSESKIGHCLYLILRRAGLVDLVNILFNLWFSHRSTQEQLNEKEFFHRHEYELKEVYDMLEDERSKSVFENILKFRVTRKFEYIKKAMGTDSVENQYFVPEIQFSDNKIIVDCGAFIGDTVEKFYAVCPTAHVIALEPENKSYSILSKLPFENFTTYKCGAWSENTSLSFLDDSVGSRVADSGELGGGNYNIEVKALDYLPECQEVTYIKMDIEGSELEALKGAANIIKKNKPKLAICIYHKPQDFFEIPLYIKRLNPDYRFYVHHHGKYSQNETVLYAMVNSKNDCNKITSKI